MHGNFLKTAFGSREFVCSAELVPGRDHSVPETEAFIRDAAREPRGIRVISLTDLPGGNPALPPEAIVPFITERGLTPLAHLSGKDGNRCFLESRLHALARIGVENILALTGDAQKSGFQGKGKPVYDLDSVLILRLVAAMQEGISYQSGARAARTTPYDFFSGAVVSPFKVTEPDQMMQLYKLELKIAVGARFIITQLGFNLRRLFELRQYMEREGFGEVPVIANVYIPTATIARMMRLGDIPGCVVPEALIRRLEKEKKPERLERAAMMVAAVRDLGFSGAHVGGFGLTHKDVMSVLDRSFEIGAGWRARMDELMFETPGEFYLFASGADGLSDATGPYLMSRNPHSLSVKRPASKLVHDVLIKEGSPGYRFFRARLSARRPKAADNAWRQGLWYGLLGVASIYRKAVLGCRSCGDCIQDHLNFAGCTVRHCYKGLRNGPCGGSRVDGTCEANGAMRCIWSVIYEQTRAAGADPRRYSQILIPPRDWSLDDTNALANRYAGLDNFYCRQDLRRPRG
jgi:methylenetetrahydrofolate reductase (NADPH)